VTYPDWHFTVRASNNEPLVRLTLEANSQQQMERKRDELLGLIRA
jgi:phosphomannomutase